MEYSELKDQHHRLIILRLLKEDSAAYTLNDSMLQDGMEIVGQKCSRDRIRTHLGWLREQGLITLKEVFEGSVYVATLTSRGLDVACGTAVVPGVKRPRPGE
jgi:hypothetical protein